MGRPTGFAKRYSPFISYLTPIDQTTTTLPPVFDPSSLISIPISGGLPTTSTTTTTSTTPENFQQSCTSYNITGRGLAIQYIPCGSESNIVRIFSTDDQSMQVGSGNIPNILTYDELGYVSFQGTA